MISIVLRGGGRLSVLSGQGFTASRHPELVSGSNLVLIVSGDNFTPQPCRKFGFTLAEVLITLGIIGIVAAMTLPAILMKIDEKENIAKWKKSYSLISNVFNKVIAEDISVCAAYDQYGNCSTGTTDSRRDMFSEAFLNEIDKNLKAVDACNIVLAPRCDNYSHVWQKNIKYKWSGIANIYSRYNALGDNAKRGTINAYNFCSRAILLADGTAVYFGGLWNGPWIVVDVNNYTKGPNQFGKDVFVIKVYSHARRGTWMKPLGASGTPGAEDASMGASGCDPTIGVINANTVYNVAGAGCSAKYLLK